MNTTESPAMTKREFFALFRPEPDKDPELTRILEALDRITWHDLDPEYSRGELLDLTPLVGDVRRGIEETPDNVLTHFSGKTEEKIRKLPDDLDEFTRMHGKSIAKVALDGLLITGIFTGAQVAVLQEKVLAAEKTVPQVITPVAAAELSIPVVPNPSPEFSSETVTIPPTIRLDPEMNSPEPVSVSPDTIASIEPEQEVVQAPDILTEIDKQKLSAIAALPLNKPERKALEVTYLQQAKTRSQIEAGFWVIKDSYVRSQLLERWYEIWPQSFKEEHKAELLWAEKQNIHPSSLAIVVDAYPEARDIIAKVMKTDNPDQFMLNPGGMLKLLLTETGSGFKKVVNGKEETIWYAFVNIGQGPALDEINEKVDFLRNGKNDLRKIARELTKKTGVTFVPENIPGSAKGGLENASGGAIYVQIMPPNVLTLHSIYEKIGLSFNIADLHSSVTGAWVFVAQRGYDKTNSVKQYNALSGWNPLESQIRSIMKMNAEYVSRFNS